MEPTLHYAPDNASLIIRLALEHVGLPYRTQLVDRAARQQQSPAYRALNPNGLIPVLETGDAALFETGAILMWLTEHHAGLGPATKQPDWGDFLKWLFFVSNTLHPSLRMMFYADKYIGPDPALQSALRRRLSAHVRQSLETLDALAATRPTWFCTNTPGAVGFYVAACLRWCALYPRAGDRGWFALAEYPHLRDICAAIESLPCCAAAVTAEGLGKTPFTQPDYPNPPEGSAT